MTEASHGQNAPLDWDPVGDWLRERGWSVDFAPIPSTESRPRERISIFRRLHDGRAFGWAWSYDIPQTVRYAWRGFFRPQEPYFVFDDAEWDRARRQWFDVGVAAIESEAGVDRQAIQT